MVDMWVTLCKYFLWVIELWAKTGRWDGEQSFVSRQLDALMLGSTFSANWIILLTPPLTLSFSSRCPRWQCLLPTVAIVAHPCTLVAHRGNEDKKEAMLTRRSLTGESPASLNTRAGRRGERERGFSTADGFPTLFHLEHRSVLGGSPRGNGRDRGCALLF